MNMTEFLMHATAAHAKRGNHHGVIQGQINNIITAHNHAMHNQTSRPHVHDKQVCTANNQLI